VSRSVKRLLKSIGGKGSVNMANPDKLHARSLATAARILSQNLKASYTIDEIDYFIDLLLIALEE
jgi:hypothetical protein